MKASFESTGKNLTAHRHGDLQCWWTSGNPPEPIIPSAMSKFHYSTPNLRSDCIGCLSLSSAEMSVNMQACPYQSGVRYPLPTTVRSRCYLGDRERWMEVYLICAWENDA